MTILFGLEVDW